jgi:hypothetical protein
LAGPWNDLLESVEDLLELRGKNEQRSSSPAAASVVLALGEPIRRGVA